MEEAVSPLGSAPAMTRRANLAVCGLLLGAVASSGERLHAQGPEDLPPEFLETTSSPWAIQVFADVGARLHNPDPPGTGNASFAFGSADLLGTMDLSDQFLALAEVNMEATGSDTLELDMERLWVSWLRSDAFHLTLGMNHTALARWNRLYHHGRWLEMTIDRPYLARFQDLGGILAMHYAGLEAGGTLRLGPGDMEYTVILSNGRGVDAEDRQRFQDSNDQKALEAAVAWSLDAVPGLQFGASGRTDRIPGDPTSPSRAGPMAELAAGSFLLYEHGPVHLLGEVLELVHDDDTTGTAFRHRTAYLQAGYRFGDWMPYARADLRSMDRGDPFFLLEDRDLDAWEALLGLRHDLEDNLAIKVEVGAGRAQERSLSGSVRRRDFLRIAVQVAWVF